MGTLLEGHLHWDLDWVKVGQVGSIGRHRLLPWPGCRAGRHRSDLALHGDELGWEDWPSLLGSPVAGIAGVAGFGLVLSELVCVALLAPEVWAELL